MASERPFFAPVICIASLDSRRARVGFVDEMGVGDDSTRKDFFIYRARSLRSLAHLSRAGLYKRSLMTDRASGASAEKILVMRVWRGHGLAWCGGCCAIWARLGHVISYEVK